MDKRRFDIKEFVDVDTEESVVGTLVARAKLRRKELSLTQQGLANKSDVSYASIRKFEKTGDISLSSLMKIGAALDCLPDFNELFASKKVTNLKEWKP